MFRIIIIVLLLLSLSAVGEAFVLRVMLEQGGGGRIIRSSSSSSRSSCQKSKSSLLQGCLLHMAPKYDGTQWVPTSPEEEPAAGYPAYKTLLLHGPKPFLTRIFQPDDYEQAVLKFMASDDTYNNNGNSSSNNNNNNSSSSNRRIEAQGNMDAYLRNPNDWAFNRREAEKRGVKYDYWTLRKGDLVKTLVWSGIVVWFFSSTAIQLTNEYLHTF